MGSIAQTAEAMLEVVTVYNAAIVSPQVQYVAGPVEKVVVVLTQEGVWTETVANTGSRHLYKSSNT